MNKIVDLLANTAPYIATALGAPGLAVGAIATLSKVIFGKDSASPQDLEEALKNATPDLILKIKQADYDYKIKSQQMEIDRLKMEVDDRGSARQREIATQSGIKNELDKVNRNLAYITVCGFFLIAGFLVFAHIPENSAIKDILIYMLGNVSSQATTVQTYFFGSSSGSTDKSNMLNKLLSLKSSKETDEIEDIINKSKT